MNEVADALETLGFVVTDRTASFKVEKVIGYQPSMSPARLDVPDRKLALLYDALAWCTRCPQVHTGVLHSLVGMWIWAALLRREVLSVPHSVFTLLDKLPNQLVAWWPSARSEVRCMANLVPLLFYDAGAPLAPTVFATDAMGSNEADNGGFGIVAAAPEAALITAAWSCGQRPGYSVTRLDGDVSRLSDPDKASRARIPHARVPAELVNGSTEWTNVDWGRWWWDDHITLGEGRAVVRLLQVLALCPAAHRHKIISLQDNMPWGCAVAKGRSPAPAVNFLLRKRCGYCLACGLSIVLPWMDSSRMPADGLSRRVIPTEA